LHADNLHTCFGKFF